MNDGPTRILFVFAWLVVGGEETEVRLLARTLDPKRFRIDVVACFRKEGMPDQTHVQLRALGLDVDTTPYSLSFEETVDYLATTLPAYDVIVSCQNVADVYPALERLHLRPPLIEHGGLVAEAFSGPKHFTSRYVGVCRSIRDAAASRMPGREHHAVEIPSMVDVAEFDPADRARTRALWQCQSDIPVVGWVGRLDRKKRVEDFVRAAAIVHERRPDAMFVVVGGPDAFMPDYADELKVLVDELGLTGSLRFLGDRADVPSLMAGFDIFCWLSVGEGMPHVVAEAGAAGLPVVATPDNGTMQQIEHGISGIFVPHDMPAAAADAILVLIEDRKLRQRLGAALQRKVAAEYSVAAVVPRWERLIAEVLAERRPAPRPTLFRAFIQGGFECSTHRRRDGRRLDVIAAVKHDRQALADYRMLAGDGLLTLRDGVRWHLVEHSPGVRDWSSFMPMLQAARDVEIQVIWDLLHYGWPDDIDIWTPSFVERFAAFARDIAFIIREQDQPPFYCPVNEPSFFSWAGGDVGYFNPFAARRGFELKTQLVRASIAAMEAIRQVDSRARFVHADPVINVVFDPLRASDRTAAESHRRAQFECWDMVGGRLWPQLGGRPDYLDIVGVNYYFHNQWVHGGQPLDIGHPLHKPFRTILFETYSRYGRPIFVSETGIEAERRPTWFAAIAEEVRAARRMGVPVEGICIYPIINHPGWDDDRHCENGLYDRNSGSTVCEVYEPLRQEIQRQQSLFGREIDELWQGK